MGFQRLIYLSCYRFISTADLNILLPLIIMYSCLNLSCASTELSGTHKLAIKMEIKLTKIKLFLMYSPPKYLVNRYIIPSFS